MTPCPLFCALRFLRYTSGMINLPPLLIFDMDGVLVDVRASYRQAIVQTVHLYLTRGLGIALPEPLVTPVQIEACKLMGGFNNDWDLTAGLLGYFLTQLPPLTQPAVPPADLDAVMTCLAQTGAPAGVAPQLFTAAAHLPALIEPVRQAGGGLSGLRQVIGVHNLGLVFASGALTAANLMLRIFQEVYLGPDLLTRLYPGAAPRFHNAPGLIELETLLVRLPTLATLAANYRLAIATGRPWGEAIFTLTRLGLAPFFPLCITHDDVTAAEAASGHATRLSKPHPWPLLSAAARLDPGGRLAAAYLGDMPDDMRAAQSAKNERSFMAIGVSVTGGEALRSHLLAAGADLVIPDVDALV